MISYQNKTFRFVSNSAAGEADSSTVFHYVQQGNIVTAVYSGGTVTLGHLIATVNEHGVLNMSYHHVNNKGELRTGTCTSTPEILANGKLRLHEKWRWTNGDCAQGESVIEEV